MFVPKRIDLHTTKELRNILSKLSIDHDRVTIDLKNQTIEIDKVDDLMKDKAWSTHDLLSTAGILTSERAKEMLEEVKRSREEWDE
jgi:hypothetical protein